ncbi:cell division protein Fic [Acrocarpospora phusangensis]|uniref:Cell division protein Fic n=1 Tax=Acrocarpospora phusangensis TaxID=1070424 RepID=A0A919QDV6_9ACTN|nr:Fic family protein [Acrocarpospora phusangensis]GIH24462.1 cell division protein Fic [Acrocarpospora phusangensis]
MKSFADLDGLIGRVPGRIVTQLGTIDFGRGSEALYRDQMPGLLMELSDRARVQSITASSAIEGVVVPDVSRAERIINRLTTVLRSRSEQELAGYRDAQDYLFREDWRPVNTGLLLHLHKLLFAHTASPGGVFKAEDDLVVDRLPDGSSQVRFKPVPAARTPFAVTDLIDRYRDAIGAGEHHSVLLAGLFILDILDIHPFEDGNGRIARAITNALLMDQGYSVGRYVSLEQSVAESADAYYQALLDSTHGWHAGEADPWPWLGYFTRLIADAYGVFADRAAAAKTPGTKQERIRAHILSHAPATFRLAEVRAAVPGVSDQTIRIVLEQLKSERRVQPDGTGRGATWTRLPNSLASE